MTNKQDNRPAVGSGVWAGSTAETYIIFASDLDYMDTTGLMENHGIRYKPLQGSYVMESTGEQIIENSYIINSRDLETIAGLGVIDNQESILHLSTGDFFQQGKRRASLVYYGKDKPSIDLGYLTPVSEEEAKAKDYWTRDLTDNQYYITKEEDK